MSDELYYRSACTVHIPTGEYDDGQPIFEAHPAACYAAEGTFRDETGALQNETTFYCRNDGTPIPAGSKIVTEDGRTFDIASATRVFDNVANQFECYELTVSK